MRRRGIIFLRRSSLGAKFDRADFSKKSWTFFGAERCEDPSSEQFEQELARFEEEHHPKTGLFIHPHGCLREKSSGTDNLGTW